MKLELQQREAAEARGADAEGGGADGGADGAGAEAGGPSVAPMSVADDPTGWAAARAVGRRPLLLTGGAGRVFYSFGVPAGSAREPRAATACAFRSARGRALFPQVDVDESRRLVALISTREGERKRRGSAAAATATAAAAAAAAHAAGSGAEPTPPPPRLPATTVIASSYVPSLLREALNPIEDDELIARAPSVRGGSVPVGEVLRFWFDVVWPKHGPRLREGRRIEFRGALSTNVEWGEAAELELE